MTTEQDETPAPGGLPPDGPVPTSARPPWVTDELIARWCGWVSRDAAAPGAAEPLTALAPFDLAPIAAVPACTAHDVETAVAEARAARAGWAQSSSAHRRDTVLAFHDLLLSRQDQVLDLIQWETGKARFHAWQEVAQVAAIARHYARRARHYLAPRRVRGMVPGLTKVREIRVPKGVVGIVSPWNYPLYLGVGDALPALLAGNAVVSKADEQTPLTLLWTRDLMAEAGLPAGLWQIVAGPGAAVGTALTDAVDFVCFTGSTATGRTVAERAARRLVGASLELGGKNPLIVRADADLAAAAAGTVTAAFTNTGQMCIHIERVYVHEKIHDAFRAELVRATRALRLGTAYDYSADVGSLTSQARLAAVTAHVDEAVAKGATVLTGGRARPDIGPLCYEPTVLEGVTQEMSVCAQETFGPVISLYAVGSDSEAVGLANQGSHGLSASIWSKDTREAARMAARIRAGSVNINDGASAAAGSIEAGMGGMGDSGLGRRHGAEGIRKYTETQTVATQRLLPLGPPKPGESAVRNFVRRTNGQLALLRRLGVR
ncbi:MULTISPECIES: succinic semialdehyde dehydrogenase [unclassified Streptomyces]|uniref:succinic semialdehyde dehydrogenase n=1 Tax=unclassified Streptomyces TaxID=2593676 RepID=UPI000DBA38E2|nr:MULTISPECIES: succinic semialdehyde dehydrogenase [unclassified Streptomyces]MYT75442.1 aldehyde dehydrogenase family protein [Streptomyces sp. SID8367]RAJ86845.1 succinate-semialdehyde dehydrogenase/glutarate-semialdehyde dehydrogenase [Streptomyces sp. PsTaAH-137]